MNRLEVVDGLYDKLKLLSEAIWEKSHTMGAIDEWVSQFEASVEIKDDEQIQALYLLSNFIYFGQTEIRALLVSMFRDLYRTPIVHAIRRENGDTSDTTFLGNQFSQALQKTRFLGVGNPSESGSHLLYYFRQENSLSRELFINSFEIFDRDPVGAALTVRDKSIDTYVFIDDLCGSGTQASEYSQQIIDPLKALLPDAKVNYLVLFATTAGLEAVRALDRFHQVSALFELDETFKVLEPGSRIFRLDDERFDRVKVKAMCEKYGRDLWQAHPLGYKDGQLILGFNHNTPDNTLPLFWRETSVPRKWSPIFKRFHKI